MRALSLTMQGPLAEQEAEARTASDPSQLSIRVSELLLTARHSRSHAAILHALRMAYSHPSGSFSIITSHVSLLLPLFRIFLSVLPLHGLLLL